MCAFFVLFCFVVRCFHLVTSIHVQFRLSFRSIYPAWVCTVVERIVLWLNDFSWFLSIFTAFDSKNTLRVQPDEIINRVIKINGTHSSKTHETKHFHIHFGSYPYSSKSALRMWRFERKKCALVANQFYRFT